MDTAEQVRLDPAPRREEFDASGARTGTGARIVPLGGAELALALSLGASEAADALLARLGLDESARAAAASSLAARGLLEVLPDGRVRPQGAALAAAHLGGGARRLVGLSRLEGERELGPALLVLADGGTLILEPGPLGSYLLAVAGGSGTAAVALERLVRLHLELDGPTIAALDARALRDAVPERPDLEVAIRRVDENTIEVARTIAGAGQTPRVARMPAERLGGLIRALAEPGSLPPAPDEPDEASPPAPADGIDTALASAR